MFATYEDLFGREFSSDTVILEISENQNVRKQILTMPQIVIKQQFLSLVQQASQSPAPIKISMTRTEYYYDKIKQKESPLESRVTFANNQYVALHQEEFKE